MIGIYAVGAEIPSVIPVKPYIVLNQIEGIDEWFVMLKKGKAVKYDDFINYSGEKEYYDANHIIVLLTEEETEDLLNKYCAEIQ